MARNTRLAAVSEPMGEAFDEHANGPQSVVYGAEPSAQPEDGPTADYSMPLFLGQGEQLGRRFFRIGREWDWKSPVVRSWIIKAGITTATAAAIALAISTFVPLGEFVQSVCGRQGFPDGDVLGSV